MARGDLHTFVQNLYRRVGAGGSSGLPDADLLDRWVAARDEAAFELLLRRHAPLVLGLCRRLLNDAQDVEDAFQATFLLLVRKARTIRRGASLGSWLYKVAYRVALRARAGRGRAAVALDDVAARADDDLLWRDLRPVLDEEVNGLPEKYRAPFILCHVQGRTNQEAADALGCPLGTVLSRLSWARERLRARLARRGLAVTSAALAVAFSQNAAPAAVPPALIEGALRTSTRPAVSGAGAAAAAPARPVVLAEGVWKTMVRTKLKGMAVAAAAVCLMGLSSAAVGYRVGATPAPAPTPTGKKAEAPPAAAEEKPQPEGGEKPAPPARDRNWVEVPAQQDGVLQVIGREAKPGEKVPPDRLVQVRVGGEMKQFYRLREGDRVAEGELLARVGDLLARADVDIKIAKVKTAEAELVVSGKTKDEALKRYEALQAANLKAPGSVSADEIRGAKLTFERYVEEEKAKFQAVNVAQQELLQARVILETYEIRSPCDGVIGDILRKRGEAVRRLEAVFRIRTTAK